jgi:hypothetical protein
MSVRPSVEDRIRERFEKRKETVYQVRWCRFKPVETLVESAWVSN